MHRRVRPQVNDGADNAGLRLAPVTSRNRCLAVDVPRFQAEAIEEAMNILCIEVADDQDAVLLEAADQIPASCIITMRTRSSAIASRNNDSSFSLPNTSVSSQV